MAPRTAALLIEDDARLGALVTEYLGKNEVDVTIAGDGARPRSRSGKSRFDVVLLDLMLPGIGRPRGVPQAPRRRPSSPTSPILMLTAKGDDVDKVVGLEVGADDYLAKPFNPRELLARVRAVLRRRAPPRRRRQAARRGELEHRLRRARGDRRRQARRPHPLRVRAPRARSRARPAACLSREQILEALKGEELEPSTARSTSTSPSSAPSSSRIPKEPRYIKTVRGVGYVLAREAD